MGGNDPSTVEVFGRGVQYGTTGKKSSFVIDTSSVGAGTLSITVDGPSKVDLSCSEVTLGEQAKTSGTSVFLTVFEKCTIADNFFIRTTV